MPIFAFLAVYNSVPEKITVTDGEPVTLNWGITARANSEVPGLYNCSAKLFDIFPIKTVSISVNPEYCVIPSGEAIGVKIHTDGLLVVGLGEIMCEDGKARCPAEKAGIKKGDRIVSVNGDKISDTEDFVKKINASQDKMKLTLVRNDDIREIEVSGVRSAEDKCRKLGIWVKDSAAGIGTMTFYNPKNGTFAALGHAVCDSDTEAVLAVGDGAVNRCEIRGCLKGDRGKTGELCGIFDDASFGEIIENGEMGLYGVTEKFSDADAIPVASRFEVSEGDAEILCDVDGNGPKRYAVEISRITHTPELSNKCFTVEVKDEELIEKTGGIVQGMSGSPIIRNGKLVGAITHVCVNDAKKGYGIFAENMLDETNKLR